MFHVKHPHLLSLYLLRLQGYKTLYVLFEVVF